MTITRLQKQLLKSGETWAAGKPGYFAIWNLCDRLKMAGVLVGNRTEGVALASMDALVDHVTVALTNLIESNLPKIGDLGILRDDLLNMIYGHAVRTRAGLYMESIRAGKKPQSA
jgi:hypothetical protein